VRGGTVWARARIGMTNNVRDKKLRQFTEGENGVLAARGTLKAALPRAGDARADKFMRVPKPNCRKGKCQNRTFARVTAQRCRGSRGQNLRSMDELMNAPESRAK